MTAIQPLLRNGYDAELLPPYASLRMAAKPIVDEQKAMMRSTVAGSTTNTARDSAPPAVDDALRFDEGADQMWNVGGGGILVPQSMWRPEIAASVMRNRLQKQHQQQGGSAGPNGRQFVSLRRIIRKYYNYWIYTFP